MKKFLIHSPKRVEFVEQRTKTGCGIACLAMLSRHLYSDVVSLFPELEKSDGGVYPDKILEALDDFGYDYRETNNLPKIGVALVAVGWKNPKISGHYVVWDGKREQFLDPLHGVINKRNFLKYAIIEYIWRITKTNAPS